MLAYTRLGIFWLSKSERDEIKLGLKLECVELKNQYPMFKELIEEHERNINNTTGCEAVHKLPGSHKFFVKKLVEAAAAKKQENKEEKQLDNSVAPPSYAAACYRT